MASAIPSIPEQHPPTSSAVHDHPHAILPPPAKQMVIKECQPKSARKRSSHGRNSQVRAQANAVEPPAGEAVQIAAFATPRAVPRISVDDLLLEDGPPSSSFTRAAETLYLSLAQNGAVILEPARHDAASLCRTLESARLYFRRRADPSSSSSPSFPEQPAWNDGGGYFQAPYKDLYFYKAGRSLNEAISDSCPPGFAEAFKYLGKVSRSAMSALARHLKVRCDFFSSLLDDLPLPIGEVSSSVLAASCQRIQSPRDDSARVTPDATEIEKGLLMLVTADFPGLQVCNSEGVWSPADQGVPPGSLLLLAGRCLHRATAGLCPASTYRVLPPVSSGTTRCALSFRLMPRPSAVIDCAVLAHAGHAVPAAMRESVCAGAFMDALGPSASAADLGSSDRESSLAVSCKLEKSSLASMVSDPVSGSLLEDAMVAQCGHSFGGATLARVMDSMVCPYCMAPVDVMALIPNLAVRSVASCFGKGLPHHTGVGAGPGAKAHKRKRDKEHTGEGKLLPDGSLPQPVKRRPKPEDSGLLGSPDAEGGGRLKGVQFPFSVNEKVLIKGNKRTPEKFFGKEAVITSQCLNGWYLVRVQDSGESVRLQYRSLQKCDGTPVEAKYEAHHASTAEAQAEEAGAGGDGKSWWGDEGEKRLMGEQPMMGDMSVSQPIIGEMSASQPMMGEMSALLQADDDSDHPPAFSDDTLLPHNPSNSMSVSPSLLGQSFDHSQKPSSSSTPLSPSLLGQSLMLSPPSSSHLAMLSSPPMEGRAAMLTSPPPPNSHAAMMSPPPPMGGRLSSVAESSCFGAAQKQQQAGQLAMPVQGLQGGGGASGGAEAGGCGSEVPGLGLSPGQQQQQQQGGSLLAQGTHALIAAAAAVEAECRGEAAGGDVDGGAGGNGAGGDGAGSGGGRAPLATSGRQYRGAQGSKHGAGAGRSGSVADRRPSEQQGPLPLWMSPDTATTILHQAISDAGGAGNVERGDGELGAVNNQAG